MTPGRAGLVILPFSVNDGMWLLSRYCTMYLGILSLEKREAGNSLLVLPMASAHAKTSREETGLSVCATS